MLIPLLSFFRHLRCIDTGCQTQELILSDMNSLHKKTLSWVIAFMFVAATGALIFSAVERPNADNESKRKQKLLDDLKRVMEYKYNMTPLDFDNFTKLSREALSSGPSWDFVDGLQFAFETLTTIGK